MKKLVLLILVVFLIISSFTNSYSVSAASPAALKRNVSISIQLIEQSYDPFMQWIQPIAKDFHNFTLVVMPSLNGTYDWFVKNQTRINQLSAIGEVIPGAGYLQHRTPQDRTISLSNLVSSWETYVGKKPKGFFMFQPDTLSVNFLKSKDVNYVLGYCFDQYYVDWMAMRGGWQLPYYASQTNALMPENRTKGGAVVLPWLTWDWKDSFITSHNYDTHPIDTTFLFVRNSSDYILNLIEANLAASSPLGYSAFSFEFDWIHSVNLTERTSAILRSIFANDSYEKLSCGNFTEWFKTTYPTTPAYHVNFVAPSSNRSIEWFFDLNSRISRLDGEVVSYVDYRNQTVDRFLNKTATVNFNQPKTPENSIDTSLQFKIDALGGGEFRAPSQQNGIEYNGTLSDFPSYYADLSARGPLPTPSIPNSNPAFEPLSLLPVVGFFGLSLGVVYTIRMKVKPKRAAVLLLIIMLFALTLSLRGVAPQTFLRTEVPASALKMTVVTYDFESGNNWGITDFAVDLDNWGVNNNHSSLTANGKTLLLTSDLENPSSSHVILSRNLSINVFQTPIFSVNISVSKGAAYHIRFEGRDAYGADRAVWWETSPLDDLNGKSTWEINAVDMVPFSAQATGEVIPTITSISIILDQPYSQHVKGEQSISLSNIRFSERNSQINEYLGNSTITSDGTPIQAIIINVPSEYVYPSSWRLLWASVTYRLTSETAFEYKMILMSRSRGTLIDGPTILTHKSTFTDIYKLETLSWQWAHSQQLTFIFSQVSDFSIVIYKDSWSGIGFSRFEVDSVEITSSKILGGI